MARRKHIKDLIAGDQVLGFMRLGLALEKGRSADGESIFRFVPKRPQKASSSALTRWYGFVNSNDTDIGILKVTVTAVNSLGFAGRESLPAEISYTALSRLRIYSKISFEPRPEKVGRPTSQALGTAFKPFKTLTEVIL